MLPHSYQADLQRMPDFSRARSFRTARQLLQSAARRMHWSKVLSEQADAPPRFSPRAIAEKVHATLGEVDLIYANLFREVGLDLLQWFLESWPRRLPVIFHAHDIIYANEERFWAKLALLSPKIAEFWAIGPGMAEEINRRTGREVSLMNTFQCPIQAEFKRDHREFSPDFTAVMLGNSHIPEIVGHVSSAWRFVRSMMPGLRPVQWFAHPASFKRVQQAGVRISPDIEYRGFLDEGDLHTRLAEADLALIPFNGQDEPEMPFAQYSIPSRITDFAHAGLPIFAAAGAGTDAYRFLHSHRIGVCSTIADSDDFNCELMALCKDRRQREALGRRARKFAEEHCNINNYRSRLKDGFRRVAHPPARAAG
jgi:hypothetical protein